MDAILAVALQLLTFYLMLALYIVRHTSWLATQTMEALWRLFLMALADPLARLLRCILGAVSIAIRRRAH